MRLRKLPVNRHAKSSKRLVGAEAGTGTRQGIPDSPSLGMAGNQTEPVVRHLGIQTQRKRGTVGDAWAVGGDSSTLPSDYCTDPIAVAAAPAVHTGYSQRISA